jgi:hypothetical protein
MTIISRGDDKTPPDTAITDAANNAVAAGSIAYQQERQRFGYVLTLARGHGLTDEQLVEASGLPVETVQQIIAEAAG